MSEKETEKISFKLKPLMSIFREPVIPYSMYSRCLELSSNFLQCKQLVSQLPVHHKHVFEYLTGLFVHPKGLDIGVEVFILLHYQLQV